MYQIKNLTFQPFRVIVDTYDKILPARKATSVETLTNQLKKMEKKGLIKIRLIAAKKATPIVEKTIIVENPIVQPEEAPKEAPKKRTRNKTSRKRIDRNKASKKQ